MFEGRSSITSAVISHPLAAPAAAMVLQLAQAPLQPGEVPRPIDVTAVRVARGSLRQRKLVLYVAHVSPAAAGEFDQNLGQATHRV
jgi:hypothetical protein